MARRSNTLERALAVIECFSTRDELGVRETANTTGISTTAAHRLLHDMERLGLLAETETPGRFRVGSALNRLAVLIAQRMDLRLAARPILAEVGRQIDETVVLIAYAPNRRLLWAVDAAEADHPIRYIWESLRDWSDLVHGASGKGILAFLDEVEREAVLAGVDEPHRSQLRRDLLATRTRGYAISHGERFVGAVGVAAPIRDASGGVVGDIVAGWPDNRTDPDKEAAVADAIRDAAQRVSAALGFRTPSG